MFGKTNAFIAQSALRIYIYIYVHIYTHIYIHIYTHTYIHIHICCEIIACIFLFIVGEASLLLVQQGSSEGAPQALWCRSAFMFQGFQGTLNGYVERL